MAFNFDCTLMGYEYRGMRSGTLDDGGKWHQLVFEKPYGDASQLSVGVPKDLLADVERMGLRKGDILNLPINASSGSFNGKSYARLRFTGLPEQVYVDDDGVIS